MYSYNVDENEMNNTDMHGHQGGGAVGLNLGQTAT